MSDANARLHISFDFELSLPEGMLNLDEQALANALQAMLGSTVFNGMPTVTGKQLNKGGVTIVKHRHLCQAKPLGQATLPIEAVIAAAPHLTDAEIAKVAIAAAQKLPAAPAQHKAHIRRAALKLASHYRLVACVVSAELSSGGRKDIPAQLNLTNGGVLVDDEHKKVRLKNDQGAVSIRIPDSDVALDAQLGGHTLGGPLLEVSIESLVPHRALLLARWEAGQTASA
jgi:hypothetical protein